MFYICNMEYSAFASIIAYAKISRLYLVISHRWITAFDRMLESRGHKFVRYADDCNIYVKSRRAAERVMTNCVKF